MCSPECSAKPKNVNNAEELNNLLERMNNGKF